MQITTKMFIAATLSVLMGIAVASPLFFSHAGVKKGPTADVIVDIVYADFEVKPANADAELPRWVSANETAYNLTYCIVMNVTNNYDKATVIDSLNFGAAKNSTKDNDYLVTTGTSWDAKSASVDGIWYNSTWVNGTTVSPRFDESGNLTSASSFESTSGFTPYLKEGVHIFDRCVNFAVVATYMDMNGTWVDVTGRINVTRPAQLDWVWLIYPVVSGRLSFGESWGSSPEPEIGYSASATIPVGVGQFNSTWAPHETRLIMLNGTRVLESSKIDTLKIGRIFLQAGVIHHLADNDIGIQISTRAVENNVKRVQLQINGDDYLYNTILNNDQMFVPDQYNVQVTVEPRR